MNGNWRLQNPDNASYNSTMNFNKDGSLVNNFYTMGVDGSNQSAVGTYSCSGDDQVEINLGSLDCNCLINWDNDSRFSLTWRGKTLIFAQSGSPEDTYLQRYDEAVKKAQAAAAAAAAQAAQAAQAAAAAGYSSGGVVYNNGGQPVDDQTPEICTVCHRIKECLICNSPRCSAIMVI